MGLSPHLGVCVAGETIPRAPETVCLCSLAATTSLASLLKRQDSFFPSPQITGLLWNVLEFPIPSPRSQPFLSPFCRCQFQFRFEEGSVSIASPLPFPQMCGITHRYLDVCSSPALGGKESCDHLVSGMRASGSAQSVELVTIWVVDLLVWRGTTLACRAL